MWKATDADEAEWKESSWRLGPVGHVSIEYSDANNEGYDGQVGRCENDADSRRCLLRIMIVSLHSSSNAIHCTGQNIKSLAACVCVCACTLVLEAKYLENGWR